MSTLFVLKEESNLMFWVDLLRWTEIIKISMAESNFMVDLFLCFLFFFWRETHGNSNLEINTN